MLHIVAKLREADVECEGDAPNCRPRLNWLASLNASQRGDSDPSLVGDVFLSVAAFLA